MIKGKVWRRTSALLPPTTTPLLPRTPRRSRSVFPHALFAYLQHRSIDSIEYFRALLEGNGEVFQCVMEDEEDEEECNASEVCGG